MSGAQVADRVHRLGDRYVNWYAIEDGRRARASLERLEATGAGTLLPGHGERGSAVFARP